VEIGRILIMDKIRVLNKLQRVQPGGMLNYVFGNMKYINRDIFQMDILSRDKSFAELREYKEYGYHLRFYSAKERDNKELLMREMQEALEGYDVFHIHTAYWLGFLMEDLAMHLGIGKVIVHAHNSGIGIQDAKIRRKYREMHEYYKSQFSVNEATHFCACSMEAADWLYGPQIPRDRILILKNAIEAERYSYCPQMRGKIRKQLCLEDRFVIGHSGRFERQKNHVFLLRVFAMAYRKNPKLVLLLMGAGILDNEIHRQAEELGIEDAVIFIGWKENPEDYLQAMDLFVLPSLFEGLPIVLVEAQAAGLHCLVSDTVSKEADLTGNMKYIPLQEESWCSQILEEVQGYDRVNTIQVIRDAGYDIREQIKVLERIYAE